MYTRSTQLFAMLFGAAVAIYGADPVIGTWKLNVAKSKFDPGPPPKAATRTYEVVSGGVRETYITVDQSGKSTLLELPATLDGRNHQIMGPGPADNIQLEKISDFSSIATLKHGDIVVGRARREISDDGKTMTFTYKGTNHEGTPSDNREVYEKQP